MEQALVLFAGDTFFDEFMRSPCRSKESRLILNLDLGLRYGFRYRCTSSEELCSAGQPGAAVPTWAWLLLHEKNFFRAVDLFQLDFDDFVHRGLHGAAYECGFDG